MKTSVILSKLQVLEKVLAELESLRPLALEKLRDDWVTRRAIERDLQILVEIVVDICQRLLALGGQVPASTSTDAIERCIQMGAIDPRVDYRKMVQFRNFVVHRYEHVDEEILVDIVNRRLGDFRTFRDAILEYCRS